ncbi:MAG: hypothetical protein AB7S77_12435 [Desulfatirhabdiaceae bacterium]
MAATNKSTAQIIIDTIPLNEVQEALINEYRRRIIRYRMVNEGMKKKYGMTFEFFESKNIVKEKDFSWNVESDAMEWEHAVEGIRYAKKKLKNLFC